MICKQCKVRGGRGGRRGISYEWSMAGLQRCAGLQPHAAELREVGGGGEAAGLEAEVD